MTSIHIRPTTPLHFVFSFIHPPCQLYAGC
uniref:Uncharacterized protein n=1 Tax=Myoviridae sp. ctLIM9 TaxID=2827678 RepID=A0A8S5T555_9CAUD|nr:MAG TPA: hypothetical protein [Myoviridae sp. ctLIM9]